MKNILKGLLIFVGGAIAGGVYVAGKFLSSKEVVSVLIHEFVDKIMYGECKTNDSLFEEVSFTRLKDAEQVLTAMLKTIDEYGYVTASEYLELCEMPITNTACYTMGWVNLGRAKVIHRPHSYVIDLPKAYKVK